MSPRNTESGATTPATMSVAGDRDTATTYTGEDTASVASAARPPVPHNTPANTVAGSTVPDDFYLERRVSGANMATLNISSSPMSNTVQMDASFDTASTIDTDDTEHHHEQNMWENEALELVENALARLAVLARDAHMKDGSKTVQEHYSERLAQIIKNAEIQFDTRFLQ